jgi:hypothetical protein
VGTQQDYCSCDDGSHDGGGSSTAAVSLPPVTLD